MAINSKEISYLLKVDTAQGEAALKKMEKKMSETEKRITDDMRTQNKIRLAEETAAINQRYKEYNAAKKKEQKDRAKEVSDAKKAEDQKTKNAKKAKDQEVKNAKAAQAKLNKEATTAYRKTMFNLKQESARRTLNLRGVAEYKQSYASSGLGMALGNLGSKGGNRLGVMGNILGNTLAGGMRGFSENGFKGIAAGAGLGVSESVAAAGITGPAGMISSVIGAGFNALSALHKLAKKIPETISKIGRGLNSFAAHLAMLGVAITYQVSARIATLGKSFIQSAMDAEESQNRFDQVFKSIQTGANKTANVMAQSIGATSTDVKNSLSSLGTMMRAMGFSQEQALSIASNLTQRSADIQSYFNVPGGVGDVTHMVRRMLVGEADPLENATGLPFNMEMYQGGIEQYKNMGMGEGFAKLLARLDYFFTITSMSAGDLVRTFNSLTNTIRRATASWKEMETSVGSMLAKGLDLSGFFNTLGDLFNKVSTWVKGLNENQAKEVGKMLTGLVALGPALIASAAAIGSMGLALRAIGAVGSLILNPVSLVIATSLWYALGSSVDKIRKSFQDNQYDMSLFGKSLSSTVIAIGGFVNVLFTVVEEAGKILLTMANAIENIFTTIGAIVKTFIDKYSNMGVTDKVRSIADPVGFNVGLITTAMFGESIRRGATGYYKNQEDRSDKLKTGMDYARGVWDNIYKNIFDSVVKYENKPQTLGAGMGGAGEFSTFGGDLTGASTASKGDMYAPAALYGSREAYSIISGNKSDAMNATAQNTKIIAQNTSAMLQKANAPKFAPNIDTKPSPGSGNYSGTDVLMNPYAAMI